MTYEAPVFPRLLRRPTEAAPRVLTARSLRERGVSGAAAGARCRPGGPWQLLLPGVYLLYPGPPTSEDRLRAALLYAERRAVPAQAGPDRRTPVGAGEMVTGLAALALHGFVSAPALPALEHVDVLLPRTRRLRPAGFVRLVRDQAPPPPVWIDGLPVAPVPRALADAVAGLDDTPVVRGILTEAVRGGHCEAHEVVRELRAARLLSRPHLADAVGTLLAAGRALTEGRLYDLVRTQGLPDPFWNTDLCLPGGPYLCHVDAYWPEQAVAVRIDTRPPRPAGLPDGSEQTRQREALERLGVTVLHLTPQQVRETPERQAAVVRTALMTADERPPAAYLVVLPR